MTEILKCGQGVLVEDEGWYSPKDKLPEDSTPVLAIGYKDGTKRVTTAEFIFSRGWINYWTGESMPIQYWRKMPDLPKEGLK